MNKQIEEMERDLRHCHYVYGDEYMELHTDYRKTAENLRNFGYRKIKTTDWLTKGISAEELEREKQEALDEFAKQNGYRRESDVAREIFEELKKYFTVERMGLLNHIYINDVFHEVQKKYESEGADDE